MLGRAVYTGRPCSASWSRPDDPHRRLPEPQEIVDRARLCEGLRAPGHYAYTRSRRHMHALDGQSSRARATPSGSLSEVAARRRRCPNPHSAFSDTQSGDAAETFKAGPPHKYNGPEWAKEIE